MAPEMRGATAAADEETAVGEPVTETSDRVNGQALPPQRAPVKGRAKARGSNRPVVAVAAPPAVSGPGPAAESDPAFRQVRRGRRVKRVIRRIELWSVLKIALVFYTCMYVVVMGALVIIWGFAYSAGLVDNFESFANDIGFENWQFYGEHMFRQAAAIGAVMVVAGTVLTVLATALVNVISELTGGIRVVVIEEETAYVPVGGE